MTFGNDISLTPEDQIRAEIIDNINVPDGYSLYDSFSSPDLGYMIYTAADKDRDLTVQYMSCLLYTSPRNQKQQSKGLQIFYQKSYTKIPNRYSKTAGVMTVSYTHLY